MSDITGAISRGGELLGWNWSLHLGILLLFVAKRCGFR